MVLNLPLNQQKSTSSVLEFSTVETMPLFDVFCRGYIAEVELGPSVKLAWFTEVQSLGRNLREGILSGALTKIYSNLQNLQQWSRLMQNGQKLSTYCGEWKSLSMSMKE